MERCIRLWNEYGFLKAAKVYRGLTRRMDAVVETWQYGEKRRNLLMMKWGSGDRNAR